MIDSLACEASHACGVILSTTEQSQWPMNIWHSWIDAVQSEGIIIGWSVRSAAAYDASVFTS